jgi:hypothetical protein
MKQAMIGMCIALLAWGCGPGESVEAELDRTELTTTTTVTSTPPLPTPVAYLSWGTRAFYPLCPEQAVTIIRGETNDPTRFRAYGINPITRKFYFQIEGNQTRDLGALLTRLSTEAAAANGRGCGSTWTVMQGRLKGPWGGPVGAAGLMYAALSVTNTYQDAGF